MKNLIRKILKESLDWVSKVGSEREQIMDDLEVRIKTMDWDVDLERESERTTDGGWYFGRLWCGDEFYELYEYEDTFTIKFYIKEYGDYRLYDIYQDLTSRELMLGMTKIIVECLGSEKLTESTNDMDWVNDIDSNLLYKPYVGMMFHTKNNPKNIFEIVDLSSSIIYYKRVGTETKNSIPIIYFNRYMKNGDWVTYYS